MILIFSKEYFECFFIILRNIKKEFEFLILKNKMIVAYNIFIFINKIII